MSEAIQRGTLYIVSTPIGNLEDMSVRAVNILSGVDLIAAEDTRKTKILLDHYKINKPMLSYFSYNEIRRTPELIAKLKAGSSIGLVSDAGTPGISDPAYRIVHEAVEEQIPVVAIPGPTAFLSALIVSGLPANRFVFIGFLPGKKGRKTMLEEICLLKETIILYESPHRLMRTLADLKEYCGDRNISISRELTKKFEETTQGRITDMIEHFSKHSPRGEFVLIIEGCSRYRMKGNIINKHKDV
jgi:16S rRNA (cytidine1402-2'-O)-methyltransferase